MKLSTLTFILCPLAATARCTSCAKTVVEPDEVSLVQLMSKVVHTGAKKKDGQQIEEMQSWDGDNQPDAKIKTTWTADLPDDVVEWSAKVAAKREHVENLVAARAAKDDMTGAAPRKLHRIHLIGPPDSGTNLMVESLMLNWPRFASEACRSAVICDVSLWKHSIGTPDELVERMQNNNDDAQNSDPSDALVIAMVRSPVSLMTSWKHAPYFLRPCLEKRAWSDSDTACWANAGPNCHPLEVECVRTSVCRGGSQDCGEMLFSEKSKNFTNIVEVYNRYLQQYNALRRDPRIGNVLLVGYEDMTYTPKVELARIANAMGWTIPDEIKILDAKSKPGSKSREEAIQNLKSRAWSKKMGAADLKKLCSLIDTEAMKGLHEGTNTSEALPYTFDCDSVA